MKIICKNTETGEEVIFNSVKEVLEEINRDRSEGWQNYDETDWKEGLKEFTELTLIKIVA